MDFIQKGSRVYWRAISSLFLGSFVIFAILYCTQPLIQIFSQQFHLSPAMASLSVSLATGPLAVFMLIASWVSDAAGRKLIMAVSLLFSAVLEIMTLFISNFSALLVIRALQGIFLAGFPAIAMVYITEEFDPKISGLVMGVYISGTSVGGLTGRLVVSTLTDWFTWHIALGFIGLISLLAGIWFWFNLPNSRHYSPQKKAIIEIAPAFWKNLKQRSLLILYLIAFLIMGGFVTLYNYISYPLTSPPYNLSQAVVGCIFVIYLVGTFSSTFMGNLADNIGRSKVLCLAILIMLAGCLITLNDILYIKISGVAVFTFGFFGSHSVASSWVGQSAKAGKSQASSIYLLFYYCGSSVLGAWGGCFLNSYDWNGVVMLITASLTLALLLSGVLFFDDALQ
jgi:YNFM family putative membrane transporter